MKAQIPRESSWKAFLVEHWIAIKLSWFATTYNFDINVACYSEVDGGEQFNSRNLPRKVINFFQPIPFTAAFQNYWPKDCVRPMEFVKLDLLVNHAAALPLKTLCMYYLCWVRLISWPKLLLQMSHEKGFLERPGFLLLVSPPGKAGEELLDKWSGPTVWQLKLFRRTSEAAARKRIMSSSTLK